MSQRAQLIELLHDRREELIDSAEFVLGNRAAAEDAVQETFLRLVRLSDREAVRHPMAFLRRTVTNLARDQMRRRQVEERHATGLTAVLTGDTGAQSAEDCTRHRESLRAVESALAELPDACRVAFEMHRLGGYSHRQIATALRISPSMVDKHIRRALTHCRDALREH